MRPPRPLRTTLTRVVLLGILSLVPLQASAATILSVTGSSNSFLPMFYEPCPPSAPSCLQDQWLGVWWSQSQAYTNVSIDVFGFGGGSGAGTAWLTTGLSSANAIATTGFNNVGVGTFSGLTLGPGTYYLLFTDPTNSGAGWTNLFPNSTSVGAGVSFGTFLYTSSGANLLDPPASGWIGFSSNPFNAPVTITGDEVPVPEPATLLLMTTGLGIAARRRFKRA